jgi:hypothetical protein
MFLQQQLIQFRLDALTRLRDELAAKPQVRRLRKGRPHRSGLAK